VGGKKHTINGGGITYCQKNGKNIMLPVVII